MIYIRRVELWKVAALVMEIANKSGKLTYLTLVRADSEIHHMKELTGINIVISRQQCVVRVRVCSREDSWWRLCMPKKVAAF